MTREGRRKILLTGYASDLAKVVPQLGAQPADTIVVNEDGLEGDVPEAADVVVFVLSRGSSYSTQVRIVCGHVFYRVSAREKFLLATGEMDASKLAFPEIAHLPTTTIAELNALLESTLSTDDDHSNL